MIVSLLLSSLFVSAANAETPIVNVTFVTPAVTDEASDATEIETSQYGVSLVVGSNCSVKVIGRNLSPKKVGALVTEIEAAKGRCLADKARRDDKARADLASSARSVSLDKLIVSAGTAGEKGIDVRVVTDDTTVEMGDHLDWQAYGEAVNGNGVVPGMPLGYVDPNAAMLYRLNGGMNAHPAIPGVVVPAQQPVADNGALTTCQSALRGVSERLATCGR